MADTIFEMLESEHREIKGLLEQAQKQPARISKFSSLLAKHVQAEEIVLYAELKQEQRTRAMALEGFEEHHAVESVLQGLGSVQSGGEEWHAKLKVAGELIDHHVQEEEQEMFPTAREVLSGNVIARMTQDYPRAEEQLVGDAITMNAP